MQYATVRLVPDGAALNAVEAALAAEPTLSRERLHHIRLLEDGTGTVLCELTGDADRAVAVLDAHDDVFAHTTSAVGDRVYVHTHQRFPGDVGRLLSIPQHTELVVDFPIEYGSDGSALVTMVGDRATLREALADVPSEITLDVESVGEYRPGAERLFAELTDRQREVLRTARAKGYFADPRGTTYEEIAADLECAPETVGEHLRKAQARLFDEIVPE